MNYAAIAAILLACTSACLYLQNKKKADKENSEENKEEK